MEDIIALNVFKMFLFFFENECQTSTQRARPTPNLWTTNHLERHRVYRLAYYGFNAF